MVTPEQQRVACRSATALLIDVCGGRPLNWRTQCVATHNALVSAHDHTSTRDRRSGNSDEACCYDACARPGPS